MSVRRTVTDTRVTCALTGLSSLFAVVILSVRGVLKRRFMLTAHTMGMTRGDWTFLDVDIFHVSEAG